MHMERGQKGHHVDVVTHDSVLLFEVCQTRLKVDDLYQEWATTPPPRTMVV